MENAMEADQISGAPASLTVTNGGSITVNDFTEARSANATPASGNTTIVADSTASDIVEINTAAPKTGNIILIKHK